MKLTTEQHEQFCEAVILAHVHFADIKKVSAWINAPNLNLGAMSPQTMIERGLGKKLLKWMEQQIDSNLKI